MIEQNPSHQICDEKYLSQFLDDDVFCCYDENFDLEDCSMISHFLQHKASRLNEVEFYNCRIKDDGYIVLSRALRHLKLLERLNLSWNRITIDECRALSSAIQHMSSLKVLVLNYNKIDDDGYLYLANMIRNNVSIKTLSLSCSKIKDIGCQALAKGIKENKTLQELDLTGNPNITEIGWTELSNALFSHNKTLHTINYYNGTISKKLDQYLILNRIGRKQFLEASDRSILLKATNLKEDLVNVMYLLLRSRPDNWCEIPPSK